VIAEYDTSRWLQNLRANPIATVRVGNMTFPVAVRILSPEVDSDLQRQVQSLSRKKYGWGEGLVVELLPQPPYPDLVPSE
jgi:hypothetical protein